MKNIGYQIGKILEKKKITKRDLAKKLNMTEVNVYKILNKQSIDVKLLYKICEVLNVNISEILLEDYKPIGNITEKNNIIGEEPIHYSNPLTDSQKEIQHLKELLAEKEKLLIEKDKQIQLYARLLRVMDNPPFQDGVQRYNEGEDTENTGGQKRRAV
jgi:DNA-binding Xre family transcriptional regulator